MKRYLPQIIIVCLLLISVSFFAQPFLIAHADTTNSPSGLPSLTTPGDNNTTGFLGFPSVSDLINEGLAIVVNAGLSATGFLLMIAASILNVSIVLTLHIREFVTATPAIYVIWQTLRDLTGFFFIFYLLYAAIQMILNLGNNYGSTIKNIVVAGILINFSFFIVSVLIDASNVTSQAIYNAMLPNSPAVQITGTGSANSSASDTTLQNLTATVTGFNAQTGSSNNATAGISDIFMNSLKIQSIYDTNGNQTSLATGNQPFKIIFIGVVGMIIMITAALSFVLAAAAFIVRLVILLFLLAFSSLWFASIVIPQLKSHVKPITDQLYAMLVFMPVYLLLMYAALSVLNNSNIMGAAGIGNTSPLADPKQWAFGYIVLAVNYAMVIVMLNLPLYVAMSMGGMASKFVNTNKFGAAGVWKKFGSLSKQGGQSAWMNTGGRAASAISRSEGFKDFASRQGLVGGIGRLALQGTRGVATDYSKKLDTQVKARTDFAESLGYDESRVAAMDHRVRQMKQQKAAFSAAGNTASANMMQNSIDTMNANIVNEKSRRQASYAGDLNAIGVVSAAPNLWMKVARKDKAAAAKINVGVWQKQLDSKKKELDEARSDLKQVKTDIKADIRQNGVASTRNLAEQTRIQGEIDTLTSNPGHRGNVGMMGTNDLQREIDRAKLIK